MAYITDYENQIAQNTPTTTNPNGDLLFDGGTYKFMRVNSDGLIISLGTDNCGGSGAEV
jgi:cytosine/adenosine deaminase-related metal-dependent hydrolase